MENAEAELEASRLKALAEDNYRSSNLKSALKYAKRALHISPSLDGVAEMVAALKILRVAGKSAAVPDWYKVLQVEPFSHINSIKKQYKKLALTLHPDKNSFAASEEAFKLVGEAFRCLSDKIRRKEYDLKLRITMQSSATAGTEAAETFWTACSTCRLLHQFERRYLGHNLVCPSCRKSFEAAEVSAVEGSVGEGDDDDESCSVRVLVRNLHVLDSSRIRNMGLKRKMDDAGEVSAVDKARRGESVGIGEKKGEGSGGREVSQRLRPKRARIGGEITLAEMQAEAMRKLREAKARKSRSKEKEEQKETKREREREKKDRCGGLKGEDLETDKRSATKGGNSAIEKQRRSKRGNVAEVETHRGSKSENLEIMAVEDSDFYDFDKDRVERSIKKGQVWAIYDDDDGMPRHYGLIDDVVSVNPFVLKMSWLDFQNCGDEGLICWENLGFHISCGRFKVARKTCVDSVNIFSHLVDCERAAREMYRIYPKKGSVWAIYSKKGLNSEGGRSPSVMDKRCYDIVLFLTSYSEMHGLSMAYLEKVDGFKTVFRRQEIGCHAIRWLEKDDIRMFSHQIPCRKLSVTELPDISTDCWELDPASLPPELLTIAWKSPELTRIHWRVWPLNAHEA